LGWEGALAVPDDFDMLHRSFVRTLRAANRSARTIEAYSLAVTQLRAFLHTLDQIPPTVAGLERRHIEEFLTSKLAAGTASSTVHQRYRSLHQFFEFLYEEEEIPANPMARMSPLTIEERPVPVADGNSGSRPAVWSVSSDG
jgi:integrase/recombinase XerC